MYFNGKKIIQMVKVEGESGPTPTGEIEITENGTHDVANYATAIVNVESSGGSVGNGEYFVKVIDYDGTILKEAKLDTGDTFTLPTPPSHDGLVFQEWSCSQEIVDNTITITDNNVMVGAVYTTASGLSEFDIELTKSTGLDVTLNMDGTKDWGDGTSDDLTTHTYSDYGKYTIKCNGTTMTTSSSSGLFGQTSSTKNYYCVNVRLSGVTSIGSSAFQSCYSLTNIVIPNSITSIGSTAFNSCYSLTSIVIPNSITSIGGSAFQSCYSLTSIVIPNSVTSIGSYEFQFCSALTSIVIPNSITSIGSTTFNSCYSLTSIVIPNSVTSIGSYAFQSCYSLTSIVIPSSVTKIENFIFSSCYSLTSIVIPSSVTSIGSSAFPSCYSLTSIVIPNSVTSIGGYAFGNCYTVIVCDFSTHTAVPTLSNTNVFTGITAIAKIIVPDNLYDEWIVATNWATYADYIYKASEVV